MNAKSEKKPRVIHRRAREAASPMRESLVVTPVNSMPHHLKTERKAKQANQKGSFLMDQSPTTAASSIPFGSSPQRKQKLVPSGKSSRPQTAMHTRAVASMNTTARTFNKGGAWK